MTTRARGTMGNATDSRTAGSALPDSDQPPTRTQVSDGPLTIRETVYGWAIHSADGAYLGVMKNERIAVHIVSLVNRAAATS